MYSKTCDITITVLTLINVRCNIQAVRIIYCPEWPRNVFKLEEVFSVLKVVQDWHLEYQDGPLVVVDK